MDLLDAVIKLARRLKVYRSGTVDSGSTTTAVDALRKENDDTWNDGTFINITNGERSLITDFVKSTGTFTVIAMTANDANDSYGAILPAFPFDALQEALNDALQTLLVPEEDETSLDGVANQREYTLPTGVTEQNLRQVWARIESSGSPKQWKLLRGWDVKYNEGGQETLYLTSSVGAGHDIRLVYVQFHAVLDDLTDEISPYVPDDKLLPLAALSAIESRINFKSGHKFEETLMRRYEYDAMLAQGIPVRLPQLQGKLVAKW